MLNFGIRQSLGCHPCRPELDWVLGFISGCLLIVEWLFSEQEREKYLDSCLLTEGIQSFPRRRLERPPIYAVLRMTKKNRETKYRAPRYIVLF